MADALVWLVVIILIALVFWALVRDYDRRMQRSAEEYEKELAEQKSSLMRAGMLELDRFVGDERNKRAAVAYLKDEEQGQTEAGGKIDDRDRTKNSER